MNLYFRMLLIYFQTFFKPKIKDILAPQRMKFHVLPNDLDTNLHMNNGRYHTIMDLGRLDLVLRTGILKQMMRQKSIPVLSAAQMRYRVSLDLWRVYDLETRIICWDDKWVYIQQRFIISKGKKAGQVAAFALLKGAFYDTKNRATVPTQKLLDKVGLSVDSPEFPGYITDWIAAEEIMRDHSRALSELDLCD